MQWNQIIKQWKDALPFQRLGTHVISLAIPAPVACAPGTPYSADLISIKVLIAASKIEAPIPGPTHSTVQLRAQDLK